MALTVFPTPRRTLMISQIIVVPFIILMGVNALLGVTSLHQTDDGKWKFGTHIHTDLVKQELFSDQNGNTIEAKGGGKVEGTSVVEFRNPSFGDAIGTRVVDATIPGFTRPSDYWDFFSFVQSERASHSRARM